MMHTKNGTHLLTGRIKGRENNPHRMEG
jgi:hypothetical protein